MSAIVLESAASNQRARLLPRADGLQDSVAAVEMAVGVIVGVADGLAVGVLVGVMVGVAVGVGVVANRGCREV